MSRVGRVVSFIRRHYGLAVSQLTATEPTDAQEGDLWVDISTPSSPALMIFDGATWQAAGGGSDFSGAYGDLTGIPSTFAPSAHASSHQDGGADEISVQGLAGLLVTAQTPAAHSQAYSTLTDVPSTFAPAAHASSHQNSGADEVATATAGANAIPKAGAGGTLAAGWFPTGLGSMKQLYLNVVSGSAVTSWAVTTGLAGDTDLIYLIRFYLVEAQLNTVLRLTFNADGAGNYGDQDVSGANTTVSAARNTSATSVPITYVNAGGHTGSGWILVYAKSGQPRHMQMIVNSQVAASTIGPTAYRSGVWTNTADAITRIDVTASVSSGIGIGSSLEIWALRAA